MYCAYELVGFGFFYAIFYAEKSVLVQIFNDFFLSFAVLDVSGVHSVACHTRLRRPVCLVGRGVNGLKL